MKKVVVILTCFILGLNISYGQQEAFKQEAMIKYNLFKGDYKVKNYDGAYENWLWCMDNSPKLSVNLYKYGITIAKNKYTKASTPEEKAAAAAVVKRVFTQRLEHFPTQDLAKVYSDYAGFLSESGASSDEVFEILHKAYKSDPSKMGVKSIYRYFEFITELNKETNVQLIFDVYDNLVEAVTAKMDYYTRKLDKYSAKEEAGEVLTSSDKRLKSAYEINSRALGQVEHGLEKIIVDLSTCERLIPFYTEGFDAHKENGAWLKSAVSRMYKKECTDDPLYDKLVEAYVTAEPSPEASMFYGGILLKNNEIEKAKEYFTKAVEQEEDAYKKANYLFKIAQILRKTGKYSEARKTAYQAIGYKRSMGQAYLLIASMYAKSANNCGTSEFQKRMAYVAALEMAEKAAAVDPVNKSIAGKYIKSYKSSIPSKKDIFTEGLKSGDPYKIGCWIGETVKIP